MHAGWNQVKQLVCTCVICNALRLGYRNGTEPNTGKNILARTRTEPQHYFFFPPEWYRKEKNNSCSFRLPTFLEIFIHALTSRTKILRQSRISFLCCGFPLDLLHCWKLARWRAASRLLIILHRCWLLYEVKDVGSLYYVAPQTAICWCVW